MPTPSAAGGRPGDGSPAALAHALLDTASITRAVPDRMRVAPAEPLPAGTLSAAQELLDRVTLALGLPEVEVVGEPDGLTAVELAVSRRLALRAPGAVADGEQEQAVRSALAAFPGPAVLVPARDGTPLRCWVAGPENAPAVAVVSACGMPVGLVARWLGALAAEYRVVTWESRGLFAAADGTGLGDLADHTLDAQSEDVLAVLDGFGIAEAHALGLCGGAVVALAAAARSDRITSLSLWHGDYELGGEAPKTAHQRDVESLLTMVSRGRAQAAAMHRLISRPSTLETLRPDIAHYLIHPYATPELLRRYGLLNGAIMSADCRGLLDTPQPALVVTSDRDTTAHPAGSKFVAASLPRAELRTMPDGDHLTAFDGGGELVALAREFLHSVTVPERKGT
ncbi:alpha/beta hydrolase [Streptomyces sp. IMTB 2501]|uniref:alpha/beta fold hydrolase n=1 Tax=Streptomyces sp. IMTB 2501 TaxID=1776340 RepID=UPI00096F124A|nr:alpha/beta hydrolase [Streptomyces sp. IMTB 2501]OLZ74130.1 alpha/beta hydrolase [Streptomyces sp. IMTB 2501]